jgi:hypothetical protein
MRVMILLESLQVLHRYWVCLVISRLRVLKSITLKIAECCCQNYDQTGNRYHQRLQFKLIL